MFAIAILFPDGKPQARQYVSHDDGAWRNDRQASYGLREESYLAHLLHSEEYANEHVDVIVQFLFNTELNTVASKVSNGNEHERIEFEPLLREIEERFEDTEKGVTGYKGLVFQIVKLVEDAVKVIALK